ncbi:MAG: methylthioribose-1-phosphate isomerase [Gammaproteobacteria bacterium]|jgi:methylthioribose-1-phosphate isomerase
MSNIASNVRTLYWDQDALVLIDQRELPHRLDYVRCSSVDEIAQAIRTMVVRGAPAIGIAAAYGVLLCASAAYKNHGPDWKAAVVPELDSLRAARPTAVNLAWAIDSMVEQFHPIQGDPTATLLAHANQLFQADVAANLAMGELGAALLGSASQVITHCNAGALATAGYGTALGVIRSAWKVDKLKQVFATETRPWLQGARLTAWELHADNIPVTLIADSVAAHLMSRGNISWVITGADRVAANGDTANKIGTYSLAVNARAHGVRFMVVAPLSTIDRSAARGSDIPIEERPGDELLTFHDRRIAALGVDAYNPVFDTTPAELIDVLVTEKGVVHNPNLRSIQQLFETHK